MKEKRTRQKLAAEILGRKAVRQILLVIMAGLLLTAADLVKSAVPEIDIVRENGKVYMVRPDSGHGTGHIKFKARVKGDSETVEKKIDVSLEPRSSDEKSSKGSEQEDGGSGSEREQIEYELRKTVNGFNDNLSEEKILLPAELSSGEQVSWETQRENNSIIMIFATAVIAFLIYRTHLSPLEKIRKQERESVIRNLPEFVNKLVLLLNAGLVLNSAFQRTITESLRFRGDERDYFLDRMEEIYVSVRTTNSSINDEFRKFAKENGTMELMRISNIINDNINKGVELTEKLQRESEVLWINRKQNCEEKGKLAETKLTLPLVMFLMVLVVITVAPALLGL